MSVIDRDLKHINSIEMIFAGSCNLKCSYCIIHKNPKVMHEYNEKVRKSVLDGKFQQNLFDLFKDHKEEVYSLSVWSGEPTINADIADKLLEPVFTYFNNANEFMFSTNTLLGFERGIKPYLDCLQNICSSQNREITFILQFSLDGPKEITDKSRGHVGITENVIQTLKDTATYAANTCKDGFHLLLTSKPTVSPENWKYLLDNDKVFEWFKFFDDITTELEDIIKDNPNINHSFNQVPTICTPYDYTKAEGVLYRDFIRAMKNLDLTKLKHYNKAMMFGRQADTLNGAIGYPHFHGGALLCSAGLGSVSVDYEGNIMTCHRIYDDWRLGGKDFPESAKLSQMIFNEKDNLRVSYLSKTFFMKHSLKKSFFDALIIAMATSGEIDKKYLEPEYRYLAYILCGSTTCFAGECGLQTRGIYIPTMSLIRLWCNGALEEIVDYYERM